MASSADSQVSAPGRHIAAIALSTAVAQAAGDFAARRHRRHPLRIHQFKTKRAHPAIEVRLR
jgi:hypothetical protein